MRALSLHMHTTEESSCEHILAFLLKAGKRNVTRNRICQTLVLYLEKAMAPHSSTLAWKIPWTEEPGRLQSMGSPRVRHDWATSLSLFTFMHWRRKWQTTPVFLPGETQGWGSLVGCRLWGRTRVGHDWSDLVVVVAVPLVSSSVLVTWKLLLMLNIY